MTRTAQPIARKFSRSMAVAMYDPTPGSRIVWPATVIASAATTKNQPPETDIIMFHTKDGIACGTSSRQNRRHGDRWYMRAASISSAGTVRRDW